MTELIRRPVIVAPMAGGVSTPALVAAACLAGALGFLPAGYKTAAALRRELDAVRAATAEPFGVNLFLPGQAAPDRAGLLRYVASLGEDARVLGAEPGEPCWDDDDLPAKLGELAARPVPVVSFTFGCPAPEVVAGLREAGSRVWVTVTNEAEALIAADSGADCLVVQGVEAGAHRGTFLNDRDSTGDPRGVLELLGAVRAVTSLPLVAAGGIGSAARVAAALGAGAVAVQCGTAFLRCPESGAHPAHKAALADPAFDRTEVTRAFSGRPARGLVNQFLAAHADAPAAYPEINNATRPLRAAAQRAGDAQRMSLWAGIGYRSAVARPAAEVLDSLAPS